LSRFIPPGDSAHMADVIFVALLLGFFALAVGLVKLCERIVGAPDVVVHEAPEGSGPDPVCRTEVAA